jgi:hypothetical protein
VKTTLVFGLFVSLTTTTTHLNGLEVLETIVMYFIVQHMQGQKVNNVGAWNSSIKL